VLKKVIWLLFPVLLACSAKSPADMQRANARAGVSVAKDVYTLVGNACLRTAAATNDSKLAVACADYLDPAYTLIVDAADAVDASWSPVAACDLVQATDLLGKAAIGLGLAAPTLAPAVHDAALFAASLLGGASCAPLGVDSGAPPASPDAGANNASDAGVQ
jgi:hypothetical protein